MIWWRLPESAFVSAAWPEDVHDLPELLEVGAQIRIRRSVA